MVTAPIRALLFDLYHTLLRLEPQAVDAEERWKEVRSDFGLGQLPDLESFKARNVEEIRKRHANTKQLGVTHPEIYWPHVVRQAWPATAELAPAQLEDFLLRHIQLIEPLSLMPAAADLLRLATERNLVLGIISNSQPYTVSEVNRLLEREGLSLALFDPDLCFWSFRFGYSKPNPHVFQPIKTRLLIRGIEPSEVLMVGDRADNDIAPARAQGFQTWQILPLPACGASGPMSHLLQTLHSVL